MDDVEDRRDGDDGRRGRGGCRGRGADLHGRTAWPAQKTYTGRAFDACTAPSLTAMTAWKKNAYYGGVAVYIGGKNRGCAQPDLTKTWVKSVDTLGWRVIPLYVGAQPPCQKSGNKERFTTASVGVSNSNDAIAKD